MRTLIPNSAVTIGTSDTIEFQGINNGDWGTILILGYAVRIANVDGELVWDQSGPDERIFTYGEQGDVTQLRTHWVYFDLTYDGINENGYFQITIDVLIQPDSRRALDENLAEDIIDELIEENTYPSGVWVDFNEWHNIWKQYRTFSKINDLINHDQLPSEPKVEDYS